jgi:hypothetical protein
MPSSVAVPAPDHEEAGTRLVVVLVLLRRFVPFEAFESFAVVGVAGSLDAAPAEV